jgi:hypothetical protein
VTQLDLLTESAKLSLDARETSRLAALRAAPRSSSARHRVLLAIWRAGKDGLIDDEIVGRVGMSPNTVRPRRVELVEGHWVQDSTRRRKNIFGNDCIVWVATDKGNDHFAKVPCRCG